MPRVAAIIRRTEQCVSIENSTRMKIYSIREPFVVLISKNELEYWIWDLRTGVNWQVKILDKQLNKYASNFNVRTNLSFKTIYSFDKKNNNPLSVEEYAIYHDDCSGVLDLNADGQIDLRFPQGFVGNREIYYQGQWLSVVRNTKLGKYKAKLPNGQFFEFNKKNGKWESGTKVKDATTNTTDDKKSSGTVKKAEAGDRLIIN
jgi:hypothetical protein